MLAEAPEIAGARHRIARRIGKIALGVLAGLGARGLVVEGRFAWADLGSWDVWARLGRSRARLLEVESRNVRAIGQPGHLLAAVGVRDLLIVQTPTATLICRPERTQAVRAVVRRIAMDPRLAAYR